MAKKRSRDADGQQAEQAQSDPDEKMDEDDSSEDEVSNELTVRFKYSQC